MNERGIFRYSFADVEPVLTLASGDMATVSLADSDGLGPDLQPMSHSLFEEGPADRGNPVYGPIAVQGAEPGDALCIYFMSIQPDRTIARTLLAPDHGFVPDALLNEALSRSGSKPRHMYHWELKDGVAHLSNGLGTKPVAIPIRPFLGCVATGGETAVSSMLATKQGGNVDHPDLVEGAKVWLPVSRPGGLLYLGDMHVAQGHGETAGGGLEISGSVTVRVEVCPKMRLESPRYKTPEGVGSLAVEQNLESASRLALAGMIGWMVELGWNVNDANMLVSQSCEFRMGGVCAEFAVVSCFIREDRLIDAPFGNL